MLMFEAEQQNTTLRADVKYMENYKALEEITNFEHLSLSGGADFSLTRKKAPGTSMLPGLGSVMFKNAHDSSETQELKAENERVKKMLQSM